MGTPTSERILKRAEELWLQDLTMRGYVSSEVPTTPEVEELKEGGFWKIAQQDLMRSEATKLKREQEEGASQERTWMFGRGPELGLKVIEEPYFQSMQKSMRQNKWALRAFKNLTKPKQISPRTPMNIKSIIAPTFKTPHLPQKPKRYHKNHTHRTSRTMRSLRHIHKKSFSFPDSVWKVRH